MAGRGKGKRGDGESRGTMVEVGCKGTEGPVGKVGTEEVHRDGSAYYKLRGEEETLKGYTTLKCNTRSQNLGLILEHRSALERWGEKEKAKSKSHTMIAYVSSFSPALLSKSSEGRQLPPPIKKPLCIHLPLFSYAISNGITVTGASKS